LPEVIKILRQLKNELSMALDVETRLMIHEVQIDAQEMMVLRGSRKGEKDDDGDVTMGKEETCHDFHIFTHFLLSSKRPNTRSNHDMALSYLILSYLFFPFHTSKSHHQDEENR